MKHNLNHNFKDKFNWIWQPLEKIQQVLKFYKSHKDLYCGPLSISISDIDSSSNTFLIYKSSFVLYTAIRHHLKKHSF